jgi:4-hydroxythreonine-4-phosphate dehydrogenase
VFERSQALFAAGLQYRWVENLDEIDDPEILSVVEVSGAGPLVPWGEGCAESGRRALAYLQAASGAAIRGDIAAIVTAPVSKESIGAPFVGQTEWLAERAGAAQFAMAFFTPSFKVVLATIHMPLRDALDEISTSRYIRLIRFVHGQMIRFRYPAPRIAVAAINPHAGEGGLFGREDIDVLRPAVEQCHLEGIDVTGPHSADSLYYRAYTGEFDVVIAPYHDQGLIPVKLIAHGTSTNVTLGLPYVRTSPDHGTAFPIAGRGKADASGMRAALDCAVDLVGRIEKGD